MPTYVATLIDDPQFAEELEDGEKGMRGVRHFLVPVDKPADARRYGTQPKRGDPWDDVLTDLTVSNVTFKRLCGHTGISSGQIGHCIARVQYATPGSNGNRVPPPVLGFKWSEKRSSEKGRQQYFDLSGSGEPIEDGEGVSVMEGQVLFDVGVYLPANSLDRPGWNYLEVTRAINDAAVQIPAPYGEDEGFTVPAGTAQYMGYVTEKVTGDLVKVVHTIACGASDEYKWRLRDAEGNPGAEAQAQVYIRRSFSGLW